ncbi:MAG: DUF2505 domain-containing protein [Dermatophilaceae bacterium]
MHIVDEFEYAATPDEVYDMMTDEEFIERKCAAQHATNYSASVRFNGDQATAVARRELPTGGFPEFVRSLVGTSIQIVETAQWDAARWDGGRTARLTVTMGSAPIGLTGTITLQPGGLGTIVTYSAELKARIPFVGGKVEQAAKPTLLTGMRKELETGELWLAGD